MGRILLINNRISGLIVRHEVLSRKVSGFLVPRALVKIKDNLRRTSLERRGVSIRGRVPTSTRNVNVPFPYLVQGLPRLLNEIVRVLTLRHEWELDPAASLLPS